jgi:diaminohydroxyphosphoribosylaminopyrimidine deaminase/5-amino-6-(5-phosphoribosylamino)uracil reductase
MNDTEYMNIAIALAAKGRGQVSPNPMVGAVIVNNNEVVGQGYHRFAERKHAEIWALEEAGERARGATIYVNLEPCSHHGRTPPCADALIAAGIKRVVASIEDPNPQVAGQGLERLRKADMEVEIGSGAVESAILNEKFIKFQTTGRPFVHLKIAESLDGRIATHTRVSKWITGPEARQASQELRYEYDAILVGIGTALADDPELTIRLNRPRSRPLVRIVLDERLQLPATCKLARTAKETPVVVFTLTDDEAKTASLTSLGCTVIRTSASGQKIDLDAVMAELASRDITSLLVEGGSETNGRFIAERLIDKITVFIAPKIIGGRAALGSVGGDGCTSLSDSLQLYGLKHRMVGQDLEVTGYPLNNTRSRR